jgi:hypothetical protein
MLRVKKMNFYLIKQNNQISFEERGDNLTESNSIVKITQFEYENYMQQIKDGKHLTLVNNEVVIVDPTQEEINNKIISQKTYELLVLIKEYERYSIPAISRQLSSEEQQLLDDYIDNLFSLLNNLTINTIVPDKLELSIKNILG